MTHDHDHAHDTAGDIKLAFFLNLTFTLLEIVGGFWTNSLAILSDALHDLGDSVSLGLSWYLDRYSQRAGDERYSYGYRRFSLLAAFINTVILIVGSLFVLTEAIPRLLEPEPSHAPGMVVFAVVGIAVNGLAALRMRGGESLNARVVTWHLLEDVLGWAAVLAVSIALLFVEANVLDPLLSVFITLYVLYNVVKSLRRTATLFLQGVPEDVSVSEIESQLMALDHVQSVHHTHVWSLDGVHHVLTTHLVVDPETTREEAVEIKCAAKALTDVAACEHATVEIEYPHEGCTMRDR